MGMPFPWAESIFYKWGCIFYERMKKSKKWCLLFEPRSSRCDVQIILDSLAKSRRKFGVRPRKILFFVEKSYIFFGEMFAGKKRVLFFLASYSLGSFKIGILTWKNMRPHKILSKSVNLVMFSSKINVFYKCEAFFINDDHFYKWDAFL